MKSLGLIAPLFGAILAAGLSAFGSEPIAPEKRFPYFQSVPVPYFNVKMEDKFWAPRQKAVREVTVPWAAGHFDGSGGIEAYQRNPEAYKSQLSAGDPEAIKFVESLAAVAGVDRDPVLVGIAAAWGRQLAAGQEADGYFKFGWPVYDDPAKRWTSYWWSHEDYVLGHYLEGGIGFWETTGDETILRNAMRGIEQMMQAMKKRDYSYAPGHQEIEQALMRLYAVTGERKYLEFCGWLIGQRGHHDHRSSFGKYSQDEIPVAKQRTIEGHAVRASYLYNGVTEYVGATGDAGYREAILAIWDDLVNHKMYLHGGGGNVSARNEGYSTKPDFIPPDDCYGESCSVIGNIQWAHNLFRLTGEAKFLDAAERMLYNAFYASLSLKGDQFFYQNAMQKEEPVQRYAWHWVPCCPPNIVKLFAKIGGLFYATDRDGIYVKHYGASEAEIPFGDGVRMIQRGNYPWDGNLTLQVEPKTPAEFTVRLRLPRWTKSHTLSVNGEYIGAELEKGWLLIRRYWQSGDVIWLDLPMSIDRITMPASFKDYVGLAALQRGPIVYCLEQQDAAGQIPRLALPEEPALTVHYRADLLGGVTVLEGTLPKRTKAKSPAVPVTFVPYGVWNNRGPSPMWVWLSGRPDDISRLETTTAPGVMQSELH